jgi:hypothetical protein
MSTDLFYYAWVHPWVIALAVRMISVNLHNCGGARLKPLSHD